MCVCVCVCVCVYRGLLSWETLLTFLFIQVMYASIFIRPGHGDAAPLAAGLALFAALSTGAAHGITPTRHCEGPACPTQQAPCVRVVFVSAPFACHESLRGAHAPACLDQ